MALVNTDTARHCKRKRAGEGELTAKELQRKKARAPIEGEEEIPQTLVRAVAGKGKKASTLIPQKELARFQSMFTNILIVHMDSLKARVKSSKRRTNA
jgi:uroporphyrinogen-III synthase